jgi:hypothetical protein
VEAHAGDNRAVGNGVGHSGVTECKDFQFQQTKACAVPGAG